MPYSLDFRKKVINFVENGGTITEAAHTFWIGCLLYTSDAADDP